MRDLYPWQKELLKQMISDTANGATIVFAGRRCGRTSMLREMADARAEFEKLNVGPRDKPKAFVFLGQPCEVRGGVLELAPIRTYDVMPIGTLNVKPKPYYHRDRNGKPARW